MNVIQLQIAYMSSYIAVREFTGFAVDLCFLSEGMICCESRVCGQDGFVQYNEMFI